jgi:Thiamine pyrophosphate enzyme, C-terminal TPP binding domain
VIAIDCRSSQATATPSGRRTPVPAVCAPGAFPEGIWQFPGAGCYLGTSGGGGIGYGPGAMAGAAIACREPGRFYVGLLGDGDCIMTAGAIWSAVHMRAPMLLIINNNTTRSPGSEPTARTTNAQPTTRLGLRCRASVFSESRWRGSVATNTVDPDWIANVDHLPSDGCWVSSNVEMLELGAAYGCVYVRARRLLRVLVFEPHPKSSTQ